MQSLFHYARACMHQLCVHPGPHGASESAADGHSAPPLARSLAALPMITSKVRICAERRLVLQPSGEAVGEVARCLRDAGSTAHVSAADTPAPSQAIARILMHRAPRQHWGVAAPAQYLGAAHIYFSGLPPQHQSHTATSSSRFSPTKQPLTLLPITTEVIKI